jgi:hypothetical protein
MKYWRPVCNILVLGHCNDRFLISEDVSWRDTEISYIHVTIKSRAAVQHNTPTWQRLHGSSKQISSGPNQIYVLRNWFTSVVQDDKSSKRGLESVQRDDGHIENDDQD